MAPNSLSPASIVIDYHSAYGPHKMTIPTKEWFPTSITGTLGSYQDWNGDPVDAEDMIMALVNHMKAFLKSNGAFDNVTIFTQATATSPNIPRAGKALSVAGTNAGTTNEAAVSLTWHLRTTENGEMKLVILDTPMPTSWLNPILPVDWNADMLAVAEDLASQTYAFSARDDHRPQIARKITVDVNDKLQKMYFK